MRCYRLQQFPGRAVTRTYDRSTRRPSRESISRSSERRNSCRIRTRAQGCFVVLPFLAAVVVREPRSAAAFPSASDRQTTSTTVCAQRMKYRGRLWRPPSWHLPNYGRARQFQSLPTGPIPSVASVARPGSRSVMKSRALSTSACAPRGTPGSWRPISRASVDMPPVS